MNKNIGIRSLGVSILLSVINWLNCYGQTVPVGSFAEDILRREQITGNSDILSSFAIRPLAAALADSSLQPLIASKLYAKFNFMGQPSGVRILPVTWLNDYNTSRPYGYNNSSLYPNVGYQSRLSGGLFLKAGILTVQLRPELVYAQNRDFATFADVQANNSSQQFLGAYFGTVNGIDAPERFGNQSITHLYSGQSKITVNYKGMELGVSTENLWWGPGVQNSIMMSNSAPGFLHWTFNSNKPLKTPIGSFEWQVIGGTLKQSGYPPSDVSNLIYAGNLYSPKPAVSRYLSAFALNWQVKWLKGLYLGVSSYDYMDKDSIYHNKSLIRRTIPVIVGSSVGANSVTTTQDGDQQDFADAFSIRQLLPFYKAELYFEWARNDRFGSLSDFLEEPEHSSAYTFGGRKLFDLSNGGFIQIKSESTQLGRAATYLLRAEPTWYVHLQSPRDGYTNDGRYIGAGIGPGSSSFMIDVSYIKNYNTFGFTMERQLHNNDLYYQAFSDTGIYYLHWIDFAGTFYANVKLKNYTISAETTPVYTLNYEYKSGSSFNLHARISFSYYFD